MCLEELFKDDDDRGKVYVANLHKVGTSVDTALDYLYFFRSMTDNKAVTFVCKMKVSSSLILNHWRPSLFYLALKTVQARINVRLRRSRKCLVQIIRSSTKLHAKLVNQPFQPETSLQDHAVRKSSDSDESKLMNHVETSFRPNLELAAIINQVLVRKMQKLVVGVSSFLRKLPMIVLIQILYCILKIEKQVICKIVFCCCWSQNKISQLKLRRLQCLCYHNYC